MNITVRGYFLFLLIGWLLLTTIGCSESSDSNPSSVSGYNYTDYYIDQFTITSEGHELSAGGSNILPKEAGKLRSESGGSCCIGIPANWRPGMKLVIKWKVDKIQDGKTPGKWYTATTEVPPYGPRTYGFVVHFLHGDRIRVEIEDKPAMAKKPEDNDPYTVQGVLDPELNKKRGEGDERHSMA
ncbi:DUF3304 domain-containing protein [Burkholderia multivorans]|uniref:DUF3304 domain-containing protein n=1 Tax=Burkholderia multivorans TaxID=87883 RepID=UPI001C24F15C|nr:DUF3304 domain-containing protein [Burkholderia multivorans]MBU9124858.1 DUF3304 domain-containing protein [Burkholderia multivorans]MDN7605625.1 DUF3304 domain-containing protein [Burkholderia multivorans]